MGRSAQRQTNQFVVPPYRTWPFVAGVATIALGAGVLIAGVPQSSEAFVMPADITTTTWSAGDGTVAVASAAPVPSNPVTTDPVPSNPVTAAQQTQVASTAPAQATATTIPSVLQDPDPETSDMESSEREARDRAVVSTTVAAWMSASAGTVPPPTTTPPTTTPPTTTPPTTTPPTTMSADAPAAMTVEPARVSIVVVNGADEAGLAGRTAKGLAAKGYTDSSTTDALQTTDRTTIFYAPGFEDEAAELAGAMGMWVPLEPRPATAISVNGAEADADLVLLLGPTG